MALVDTMAVPDFQTFMLPLLRLAADGREWSVAECREPLANQFELTEEDRKELVPSGKQPRFHNRVAWAKVYLERAGLLNKTRRAHFTISNRGLEVLKNPPERIDIPFLKQFEEFEAFRSGATSSSAASTSESDTPEETLQTAYQQIRNNLASELLEQIKSSSAEFFEQLILDVMLAMGYGGSRDHAGQLTKPGADAGIDGIINEDQLGLDVIYLQAKKWDHPVGRPEIQRFVGALHGQRARKGVFITTSTFSREAYDYVATIDPKVVLIDGTRLAQHMIDFGVGVSTVQRYEIKRIDTDYFVDE